MTGPRVLIIDDEEQIQQFLRIAMTAAGYEPILASSGAQGLKLAATMAPDIVLLDLGLPDCDGKDVLRDLRAFLKIPVIVLSARDRESEKIAALDLGADDYVEKPFGMGELLARLRTASRHSASARHEQSLLSFGSLVIDLEKRVVIRNGSAIWLTPKEYDLLALLARHAGRVMTHRQLLTSIWGPAHREDTQYLRVLVGQLRSKIEPDSAQACLIQTELGVGYRFAEPA